MDYTQLAYAISQTFNPQAIAAIWRLCEPGTIALRQGDHLVLVHQGSTRVH